MTIARRGMVLVLASVLVAGCSSNFGGPKKDDGPPPDPNVYPASYRNQIATFLMATLRDRADFRNSFIAPPVLRPFGDIQHYIVCVQLDGHNQHKDMVAIYLAGNINQFIAATPDQCANAPYEAFKELAALSPS